MKTGNWARRRDLPELRGSHLRSSSDDTLASLRDGTDHLGVEEFATQQSSPDETPKAYAPLRHCGTGMVEVVFAT